MKKAILLLAWGAGTQNARIGLANFEAECRRRFPGWLIRWAYTSPIFRDRSFLQKRKSDSVSKALFRLKYERISAVAIQPLHLIPGSEYEAVRASLAEIGDAEAFRLSLGAPLLQGSAPMADIANALMEFMPEERCRHEPLIYMGHGGKSPACSLYESLDLEIVKSDANIHIGTMGGRRDVEFILPRINSGPVWLMPLLATIGRHAMVDMAGDAPGSWKSRLNAAGFECRPVLRGLVESADLAGFWLDNLQGAVESL